MPVISFKNLLPYLDVVSQTWDMLFSKLDVDIIIPRFCWTVSHFACPVFHIFTVYVHFAWTLN